MASQKNGPLLSFQTESALIQVGGCIRIARLRRGESEDMACERVSVSRQTWRRLEQGHPGVSIGLLFEALLIYGFTEQLFELGHPDHDAEGKTRDAARIPKYGRRSSPGKALA